ncbi:MAG: TraC family protein [bacterium]|nr:TraC family protein [bacterium]
MDFTSKIFKFVFGPDGGITRRQLRKLTQRNIFSSYLPYIAYDDENRVYFNRDESFGFIWECTPLVYASASSNKVLEGLFSAGIPKRSVMQFILYSDPNIDFILNSHANKNIIESDLIEKSTRSVNEFLKNGANGLGKMQGIPVRNFRLFVALKFYSIESQDEILDIRDSVNEILRGVGLSPGYMTPDVLINFLLRIFNDQSEWVEYDDKTPISKQIIKSESEIETFWSKIRIATKYFGLTSVKKLPREIPPLLTNKMIGGIWGFRDDTNQIANPFIFTTNLIFDELRGGIESKCNLALNQKAFGSLGVSLARKQKEYMWASGELDRGTPFVRVMPMMWHIAKTEESLRESQARAKRLWESLGFLTQEDKTKGMLNIMLLSSLPFGLYNESDNVEFMNRDFIMHSEAAVNLLPVQGDFSGTSSDCTSLFIGRKGQLVPMSVFTDQAINYNGMITASSGGGKSFFMNYLVHNDYKSGTILRIIDLGGSYKKICKMHGGKFIEFTRESKIIINPFSMVKNFSEDLPKMAIVLLQMVFSSTNQRPTETENSIIKSVISRVWGDSGKDGTIDEVHERLNDLKSVLTMEGIQDLNQITRLSSIASEMAYNLKQFTSKGVFGHWFNGPSTINIDQDDFVVLELEDLKAIKELFDVVTLQILNMMTSDLYLSDRTRKRKIIFDESWQFISEGNLIGQIIEEGMRLARKYKGSFTIITQSILDLLLFGRVGPVINSQAAFKFFLESPDFEKAKNNNLLDVDEFTMDLMKSLKTPRPRYSEIFVQTPMGMGVMRLVVNDFLYYMFTSDASENAEINAMVARGMNYSEAITEMIRKYGR